MFTGLVQTVGEVVKLDGAWLEIGLAQSPADWEPLALGESISVSGACLTVVAHDPLLAFELSEETLRRTTLGELKPGDPVNLERALRLGDRLGGHLVSGHVDAVGKLLSVTPTEKAHVYRFETGDDRYLIDKGSIAIEGISLTVVEPQGDQFDAWIIPHTLSHTNLAAKKPGDPVNLEFDQVLKYLEKLNRPATGL